MEILKEQLDKLIKKLSEKDRDNLENKLKSLMSVYPFNEYEYIISNLLAMDIIDLKDYHKIRKDYIDRSLYLYIFEITSPTKFGISWAQGHIKEIVPELQRPQEVDDAFNNEYDFVYKKNKKIIKIEIKASRAVDSNIEGALYEKALSINSKSSFDMNFQQIKPKHCDVFVWVSVFRDSIKYWILSSEEVAKNKYYSKGQHRGNVDEGQLHINEKNIKEFEKYSVPAKDILKTIIKKSK